MKCKTLKSILNVNKDANVYINILDNKTPISFMIIDNGSNLVKLISSSHNIHDIKITARDIIRQLNRCNVSDDLVVSFIDEKSGVRFLDNFAIIPTQDEIVFVK